MPWEALTLITLFLRYTINPNKLSDIAKYAADEQIPICESGGKILGYFMPTAHAIKFPGLLNIVHRKTAECLAYVEHGRTPRILVF